MRGRLGSGAALVLLGVAAGGCSLSGLDGGSVGVDASAGDSGAAGDGCSAVEDCTNGVDDNCNGLVDCADPACTTAGFACTAAVIAADWTLVAFSPTTRPICPSMYGAEQAIVSGVDGGADSCGCVCSGGPAVCGGTATYNAYPNSCATGAAGVNLAVNNGACTAVATGVTAGDSYQLYFASTAQAQQGTCSGAGMVTAAPTPTFNAGATCAEPAHLGAGCSAGACAPPTGAAFKACISHAGDVACPTFGFTQQLLVSTGDPGYVDMRSCGACPCATSLGCGTVSSVALFTNGTCAGGAAYGINTGCQLAGSGASIGSYQVAFPTTGDPTCQPTGASAPGGDVTLDSHVETICCAP